LHFQQQHQQQQHEQNAFVAHTTLLSLLFCGFSYEKATIARHKKELTEAGASSSSQSSEMKNRKR